MKKDKVFMEKYIFSLDCGYYSVKIFTLDTLEECIETIKEKSCKDIIIDTCPCLCWDIYAVANNFQKGQKITTIERVIIEGKNKNE